VTRQRKFVGVTETEALALPLPLISGDLGRIVFVQTGLGFNPKIGLGSLVQML